MKDIEAYDWVTYTPEWDGNRDEDDPITVELRPVTMRESETYADMIVTKRRPGFRNQSTDNTVEVARKQFFACCRNIRNLRYGGKAITSPQELWETPLTGLINELTTAINDISVLSGGEAKNSGSQSAGSPKGKAGTAESA